MNVYRTPPRAKVAIAASLVLLIQAASPSGLRAQGQSQGPPPLPAPAVATVVTRSITGIAPVIDGRFDDAAWAGTTPVGGFVQREPDPGLPSGARTEVRVIHDDQALYVAFRAYADPATIRAVLSRRDDLSTTSDRVAVYVDSYFDRRTAFMFSTTPRGAKADLMIADDTREDPDWDAVWAVATTIDAEGWTAEFRIPLSQLRFSAVEGREPVWGVQFMREVAASGEVSFWAPISPSSGRMVSDFGELRGLGELRPSRRYEVLPYSVGSLRRFPGEGTNPFYNANDFGGSMGADVRYGLTSDLTLTATINPDFGQVDADPSVVNLTNAESFFPEKRPFFSEGADIFRVGMAPEANVFYSRRVARSPQRRASAPAGGYVDQPDATRLLGAAKISGKTVDGWSIGLFNAVTSEVEATAIDTLGIRWAEPIEPLTNYAVARVVRDFSRGASGLGMIATATNRRLDDDRLQFLRSAGYVAGVNGWHRFGPYQLSGLVAGSSIHGDSAAIGRAQRSGVHLFQRPDADHLTYDPTRTSMQGLAGQFSLEKLSGSWIFWLGTAVRTPGVDFNDAGFQTFADSWWVAFQPTYRQFRPGRFFRNWSAGASIIPGFSLGREYTYDEAGAFFEGTIRNYWSGRIGITRYGTILSPEELRGGPLLRMDEAYAGFLRISSDRRRSTTGELQVNGSRRGASDAHQLSIRPSVNVRPTPQATITLEPELSWNVNPAQYLRTVSAAGVPHYLVGSLDQSTVAMTARVGYVFTPSLSLDVYTQPFVSAGRYLAFREPVAPRAERFDARFRTYAPGQLAYDAAQRQYSVDLQRDGTSDFSFSDPDFNVREFRSNAVVRWEYRPGSTIFLVWSQARDDRSVAPELRLDRDLDRLFGAPSRNVFMVKASYWLGG